MHSGKCSHVLVTMCNCETNSTGINCTYARFSKAFDRVKWLFLDRILKTMEFPERWIIGMWALKKYARSYVLGFEITRSVRQGCPLAPYLFDLYAESLSQVYEFVSHGLKAYKF